MEAPVETVNKRTEVTGSVFGEIECMISAPRLVLRLPKTVLIPLNSGNSLGLRPSATIARCWQPASVTPAKQLNPSEVTIQPGARSALAQSKTAYQGPVPF